METGSLEIQLRRFTLNRQRFESRIRFFQRCIEDVTEDFHKQYGSFYLDWEATKEACEQYVAATHDYLRTRDIVTMEFKLLLGAIEQAETVYAVRKAHKRYNELMDICTQNDTVTLGEIDEDIANVRDVYRMIALAECEREEE